MIPITVMIAALGDAWFWPRVTEVPKQFYGGIPNGPTGSGNCFDYNAKDSEGYGAYYGFPNGDGIGGY